MNIFNYDNEGVGQDANLTMDNDTTSGKDFTQTDLDNGLVPVYLLVIIKSEWDQAVINYLVELSMSILK